MAVPMWRMNGLWRRMAGLLLLCALLLSNEVMCQDDQTTDATGAPDPAADATAATDAPGSAADSDGTAAPPGHSAPTGSVMTKSNPSAAPSGTVIPATTVPIVINPDSQDEDSVATAAAPPDVRHDVTVIQKTFPDVSNVLANVKCVKEEDIQEGTAVKAEVGTDNCEATKRIIEENSAKWGCHNECNLEIFQNGNRMLVATKNAKLSTVADVLMSDLMKEKLDVKKAETPSSSSGSSVFVGTLVSGLLAALTITIGYFKCQRRSDSKGVRLAEEAYPVDQENQGNTLVSVAPLNPPPETPEKPSVNGESPEAAKTQPPPPTNGHSTAKTADTEL